MDLSIGEQILHLMVCGLWMGFPVVMSQNREQITLLEVWVAQEGGVLNPASNELGACTSYTALLKGRIKPGEIHK